jgi:hypothetical protein
MSKFYYTLPSGSSFVVDTPAGTTQNEADYIFYNQVAAGALVGFEPGQSVGSVTSALTKFTLSRLDRGTAGVDDTVILSIVNGLPTVTNIPSLLNVPLENPVTRANVVAITDAGYTAPAIGPLTSNQIQALMAQVANSVGQPANVVTEDKGVGKYGFSCQQLEIAGYVKPGTYQQFIQTGRGTLIGTLNAPGIWTGLDGIYSLEDFLASGSAQNNAQARLMQNGYNSLQATGVIRTPATQSTTAVVGEIYSGTNQVLTQASATVTNAVTGQVASLVTNASKYGTQLTSQWATDLPSVSNLTSNLTNIRGLSVQIPGLPGVSSLTSGITSGLSSVKTAMDSLGKASQFASQASSTLTGGLEKLSALNVSNINVTGAINRLQGTVTAQAGALAGQLQGQASALVGQAQAQAGALAGQLQGQLNSVIAQAQGQVNSLLGQGDKLVASVQKAAGFANTVNRATVDVATTKIFGSAKIPTPSFGPRLPDSASLGAALDIKQAQGFLKNLQNQGTGLVGQLQGQASSLAGQAGQLAGQAQAGVNNAISVAQAASQTQVNSAFSAGRNLLDRTG